MYPALILPVNDKIIRFYKRLSRAFAVAIIVIGFIGVIGWAGNITAFRSILWYWPTVKPITSTCGILSGLSLYYFQPARPFRANIFATISYVCGWLVLLIALAVIVRYVLNINMMRADLLLENKTADVNETMQLYSAACFLCTSFSFIFYHRPRLFAMQQTLTVLVLLVSMTALCNYLYYRPGIFYSWGHIRMGMYTALIFLLLSLGIIIARPELRFMALVCSDTLGGRLIRNLFLKVVLVVLVLAELQFLGMYYDYFDDELGMTLSTVVTIATITYVFWRASKELSIEDIERKKAQALLTQSNEELTMQTERLMASNKELEQFAYVASHDLQEPLKTISNYSQLIDKRLKGKLDHQTDSYLEFLSNATIRMRGQIRDLLEFARVEREKKMETVDCNTIVHEVLDDLEGSVQESHAAVVCDTLPVVFATHLKQLFQNLISNAIKYRRRDVAPKIHIGCNTIDNSWLFSVEDNGIGIDKKYSHRIFNIFQKLHSKQDYEGSGIGLAICKKIVEMHGGKIWIESKPGAGTTFYFTIPKKLQTWPVN
jgi:signal transduction histidine kinase